jgi:hypothetical protein
MTKTTLPGWSDGTADRAILAIASGVTIEGHGFFPPTK